MWEVKKKRLVIKLFSREAMESHHAVKNDAQKKRRGFTLQNEQQVKR